ncbi:MAG: N-acetyl-gamma-glutamyl-phosphate reductase [Gemmatimonadaceae bacterium]
MHKIPVGILGASGYAGRELCALVVRHPAMELMFAAANERRGEQAAVAGTDVTFIATADAPLARTGLVFSALPHGVSAEWVARVAECGAKAVDLSADLRPGNGYAGDAPYGLTELVRARIPAATVVANPGCYPTVILLSLAPLLSRGLIPSGSTICVTAASGATGAGSAPRANLMFAELTENFSAYAAGNSHRHMNEMRAFLGQWGEYDLIFTPHLLPVARGILATLTVHITGPLDDCTAPWREDYAEEPFIELADAPPTLRDVTGRNVVRIAVTPVSGVRQPALVITAAIDNLIKGAAGQAVQNANLMLGLAEPLGLPA